MIALDYVLFDPDLDRGRNRVTYALSGPTTFSTLLRPNSAGALATEILAGSYRLTIRSSTAFNHLEAVSRRARTFTGRSNDHFAFTITPMASVPEPATWASLIVGAAGVGGVARRRRRTTAIA